MFCPSCGFQSLDNAKFCKKCGILLDSNDNIESNAPQYNEKIEKIKFSDEEYDEYEEDSTNGVLMYIGKVILAIAILYGSGWDIVGGISQFNLLYLSDINQWKEVIVDSSGLLFALDSKYYGIVIVDRFFDSSFVSWAGFFIATSMVLPFRFFFFSSSN